VGYDDILCETEHDGDAAGRVIPAIGVGLAKDWRKPPDGAVTN
jgi:hypothetical protein